MILARVGRESREEHSSSGISAGRISLDERHRGQVLREEM